MLILGHSILLRLEKPQPQQNPPPLLHICLNANSFITDNAASQLLKRVGEDH